VRVFFYLEDRERTFDSPTDKLLMSVTAFADELERQKAALRVYDAMQRKAHAGHVCGGRVFGYDNLEVLGANGERSHVERRVNEAEAAVVRRIFQMSAAGFGQTRIAKTLNADGVPAPRAQQGRPVAWAPSTSGKYSSDRSTVGSRCGTARRSAIVGARSGARIGL
jgi:site-specific DNA recombinase